MSKYSSILKSAKDLLTKPFNYDNKVELKTTSSNGVAFTSDASISGADGSAAANVKVEYKKGNLKVDKLTLGTDKKIVGEFSLADVAPGTDASFKFTEGSRAASAGNDATVGFVHKVDGKAAAVLTLDAELVNGPNFDASALVDYEGVLVGGAVKVNTSFATASDAKDAAGGGVSLADYNALLGYRTDDFTLAATTKSGMSSVDVSLVHNASKAMTAGFIASFATQGGNKPFGVLLGAAYKVDSDTTVTGTASSTGHVSLAYKQKMNSVATLTASAQVDAMQLGSDTHKFGLTIALAN